MIFLDTGFVFALLCKQDTSHEPVKEVMASFRGRKLADFVLTTNHVVEETLTLVRSGVHRDRGIAHDITWTSAGSSSPAASDASTR